jgi:hypothetical protein
VTVARLIDRKSASDGIAKRIGVVKAASVASFFYVLENKPGQKLRNAVISQMFKRKNASRQKAKTR